MQQTKDGASLDTLKPLQRSDADAALVTQWAPCLRFDEREPFFPLAVGYHVLRAPGKSPSSKFELDPEGGTVIEYAIWWDWDIQHLYELEHIWLYLDANGDFTRVEASAHGHRLHMMVDNAAPPLENGRVTLYSEPGKHAFGANFDWMRNIESHTLPACGEKAGNGGIHTGNPFGAEAFGSPTPLDHRLASLYMKRRSFTPAYDFSRLVDLRDLVCVPWADLAAWIPARIQWWCADLRRNVPHLLTICLDCGDTIIDEATEIRDEHDIVQRGDPIPGGVEMVRDLHANGYTLALVADGKRESFENLLQAHTLWDLFAVHAISSDVGPLKPAPLMFTTALDALDIDRADYGRVVMVGNNLARDIKGANDLGLISVWLSWSPRRARIPADDAETPDFEIQTPGDLLALLQRIELDLPPKKV